MGGFASCPDDGPPSDRSKKPTSAAGAGPAYNAVMTNDELQRLVDSISARNDSAHTETRRHFDSVAEHLERKFDGVAESVAHLEERLSREVQQLDEKVERGVGETQA